jgi:DNA-binding LacI/PurR family transcriptional regulator
LPNQKRATIRDVAAEAGVSKSLVSLVFSKADGVSDDKRIRVMDAAKKLGFTPNVWARSLATGAGNFVGILVVDLHNPLFTEIADLTRRALLERGQNSFMAAAIISERNGKKTLEPSTVNGLLDLRPQGILVVGSLPSVSALKSVPDSVPIVFATSVVPDLSNAITVRSDEAEGMRLIVKHLTSLGHKRIAYLGPNDDAISKARLAAFKVAMKTAGVDKLMLVHECERTEAGGHNGTKLLMVGDQQPTAIVAFNDMVAIGAQEALDQFVDAGGKKIALTGYDNTYIAALSKISLTSIEQEKGAIATQAAELLTNRDLSGKSRGKEFLLLPRLVIRQSTAGVVARD